MYKWFAFVDVKLLLSLPSLSDMVGNLRWADKWRLWCSSWGSFANYHVFAESLFPRCISWFPRSWPTISTIHGKEGTFTTRKIPLFQQVWWGSSSTWWVSSAWWSTSIYAWSTRLPPPYVWKIAIFSTVGPSGITLFHLLLGAICPRKISVDR